MNFTNTNEFPTIETRLEAEATSTKFHSYFPAVSLLSEVVSIFGVVLESMCSTVGFSIEPGVGLS